jgi:hypothetical protein
MTIRLAEPKNDAELIVCQRMAASPIKLLSLVSTSLIQEERMRTMSIERLSFLLGQPIAIRGSKVIHTIRKKRNARAFRKSIGDLELFIVPTVIGVAATARGARS